MRGRLRSVGRAVLLLPYSGLQGFRDMTFEDPYRITKSYAGAVSPLVFAASVAVGIYFGIPLHELMHRAGDMLGGGWFGPVYVDPWFGGSVYQNLLPGLISDNSPSSLAIFGAGSTTPNYTQTGTVVDYLHAIVLQTGPSIVLTPLGLMLLRHGMRRKSAVEGGLGFSSALIPLLDLDDLAGIFVALLQGPSFTFVQAISEMGFLQLAPYLLAGVILAGLLYKGSKKLVGKLDSARESLLEREIVGMVEFQPDLHPGPEFPASPFSI